MTAYNSSLWTKEKLQILSTEYPDNGAKHVANLIGMDLRQVQRRVQLEGLRRKFKGEPRIIKRRPNQESGPFGLSPREIQVLRAMTRGRGYKHIANTLHLSRETITGYVGVIFRKMGVHSQVQAVLKAERAGLFKDLTF